MTPEFFARAARAVALITGAVLAVAACTGGGDTGTGTGTGATTSVPSAQGGDDLLARLRDGGFTVVIRHAATDQSRPDDPAVDLDDCSTQRNLSGEGRADAQAIGNAISRLDIPVGETWASPYCRSRDTAQLAFDRFEVVHGLERLYPERDEQADRRLNQRIQERAPEADEPNLIIVSHGVYPSVLAPAVTLGEGEAALYARADNGFELVDRVDPSGWDELGPEAAALSAGPARAADSVVSLEGPDGTGSAFRVAVPGILVTSAQLVANAREVTVVQPDGSRLTARVLGRERDVDIAALRVADDSGLPPLHSGSGLSEARTGDRAFAIGASGAVTAGSIRALGDPVPVDGGGELEAIHIDAEVPRGSAGGPLVNEDGDVLGVLTMAAGASEGGVAIPVDVARNAALGIVRGN
ncbi:trypsin-like peptidase domain-containing protein [Streptomyces sp. DG2A-72]|uniref:trypsin-like peptidase domain-containing protein n=1 Tax=Streptomyces sp. DG2A-72 TaxID=3051386 RepID=UPI00265C831A|nr:trypsin-like peptidase domain-containing protein [Streptomyces sp. DG2A-72]MDO0937761.1 trypsin-like peptidase domain-containing protein [Streptomyces sp. DG2A-72]